MISVSDYIIQGYAVLSVTLAQQWKEVVGFYPDNSSSVTTSEDSGLPARLTVERRNSSLLGSFVVCNFFNHVLIIKTLLPSPFLFF